MVRARGRGRGHPVGEDRRVPGGLPLLLQSASSTRRCRPRRSSTPTRCSPRPRETAALGAVRVLHRARRPRPRRAHDAAHPRARAAGARRDRPQRGRVSAGILTDEQARAPRRRRACTATTTTSRRRGRYFPRDRHDPHVGGALRHLPARARARHGAVLRRAARHGRDRSTQRIELLGQLRDVEPGRGAAQLPQPPAGHAARRPAARRAARGDPLDRAVPPRRCRR